MTSKNFDAEVLKSKVPVVVDFWAAWCIAPNTLVFQNEGSATAASKIKKGNSVLAYDGERKVASSIISSKKSRSRHCKEIVTDTGRSIKVTDNHRFFTSRGWQEAEDLRVGDKVAVYPYFPHAPDTSKPNKEATEIVNTLNLTKFADSKIRIKEVITKLKSAGLFPLLSNNPKMPELARLAGALFADGSLYRNAKNNYCEVQFTLGSSADVNDLVADLETLGFRGSVKEATGTFTQNGRKITIRSKKLKVVSTALWLLMQALGVSNGRKTDVEYTAPLWLKTAGKAITREFLAGYLGGDGPALRIHLVSRPNKKPYNALQINDIEFHKREDLINSGIEFAKGLSDLLSSHGVEIRRVFVDNDRFERADGTFSKTVHISVSSSFASGLALAKIGYAYCRQKQLQANFVGEFLLRRLVARNKWHRTHQKATSFSKKGFSVEKIAKLLKINYSTVYGWLKLGRQPTTFKHFEKYPGWLREVTTKLNGGLVWEEIADIYETYLKEVQSLVVERYSNLFANGFLVHNCGPCRIFSPTVEEVSKEYDGKIKFVKLNTDENQEIAANYNIMSIPTALLFEGGEVKAMSVGAIPKAQLKKWIDSNL